MAADQGEPRRRAVDPLMAGIGEGVASGYRAVESVVEGLAESLRQRPGTRRASQASARQGEATTAGSRRRGPAPRAGRDRAPATVVVEIADLTAELLDRLGEAVHEIADHVAERDRFEGGQECPTLELRGVAGASAKVEFRFTNTGSTALGKVTFEATDLVGAQGRIDAGAVSFKHRDKERLARIPPSGSTPVTVAIEIPDEAPVGTYRGCFAARSAVPAGRRAAEGGPAGAWAVLELEVVATDPRRAITPTDTAQDS